MEHGHVLEVAEHTREHRSYRRARCGAWKDVSGRGWEDAGTAQTHDCCQNMGTQTRVRARGRSYAAHNDTRCAAGHEDRATTGWGDANARLGVRENNDHRALGRGEALPTSSEPSR
jgi:hypothetical protein